MTTATEKKSKTFISKGPNPVYTLQPPRNRKNPEGDTIERIPGVKVEFENHQAKIEEDQYGRVLVNGKPLSATVYEPDGSTHDVTYEWIIDRLLGSEEKSIPPHWCLNRGAEHNAFYVDEPTPEPEPRLDDQIGAITRAAVDRDVDAINEVLELERETHNRDIVILQGEAALRQIAEEQETA
jgi:hypothetical protein